MNIVERVNAHLHVRAEDPAPSRFWQLLAAADAELRLGSKTIIIGSFPEEDGLVVLANHVDSDDIKALQMATELTARRDPLFWARRTLLEPEAVESPKATERRAMNDDLNASYADLPSHKKFLRRVSAYVMRQYHPIPVDIGGSQNDAAIDLTMRYVSENNRLIAIFGQGTRKPKHDILDMMPGTATMAAAAARAGEDLRILPVGISGTDQKGKIIINIGQEALRYSDIPIVPGQSKLAEFRRKLEDSVASLIVDPDLNTHWWLNRHLGWAKDEIDDKLAVWGEDGPDLIATYRSMLDLYRNNGIEHQPSEEELMEIPDDFRGLCSMFYTYEENEL